MGINKRVVGVVITSSFFKPQKLIAEPTLTTLGWMNVFFKFPNNEGLSSKTRHQKNVLCLLRFAIFGKCTSNCLLCWFMLKGNILRVFFFVFFVKEVYFLFKIFKFSSDISSLLKEDNFFQTKSQFLVCFGWIIIFIDSLLEMNRFHLERLNKR